MTFTAEAALYRVVERCFGVRENLEVTERVSLNIKQERPCSDPSSFINANVPLCFRAAALTEPVRAVIGTLPFLLNPAASLGAGGGSPATLPAQSLQVQTISPQLLVNAQGQIIATIGGTTAQPALLHSVAQTQPPSKPTVQGAAAVTAVSVSQAPVIIAPQPPSLKTMAAISAAETPTVGQLVSSSKGVPTLHSPALTLTLTLSLALSPSVEPQGPALDDDGINLEEIREFAKNFKIRRLSLGLTQTQVGQALTATEGPAYSQSAICSNGSPTHQPEPVAAQIPDVSTQGALFPSDCRSKSRERTDLLKLTREDVIQICGPADGIRLFNAVKGRVVRPRLTIYVCQESQQTREQQKHENGDAAGGTFFVYHAIYLEELTAAELTEKIAQLFSISPQQISQIYKQGPTGIHVLVCDEKKQLKTRFLPCYNDVGPSPTKDLWGIIAMSDPVRQWTGKG
ncbi:UNVERIFIED_CONTAM: hypothetical protein FKN15_018579 [Acipenser sinensis]